MFSLLSCDIPWFDATKLTGTLMMAAGPVLTHQTGFSVLTFLVVSSNSCHGQCLLTVNRGHTEGPCRASSLFVCLCFHLRWACVQLCLQEHFCLDSHSFQGIWFSSLNALWSTRVWGDLKVSAGFMVLLSHICWWHSFAPVDNLKVLSSTKKTG